MEIDIDATIAAFEQLHEELEDRWCLPWCQSHHLDPVWRHALVQELARVDDETFDAIAGSLLDGKSHAVRGITLHLIGDRPRSTLLPQVRASLGDPDPTVWALAAAAIGRLEDEEGFDDLLDTPDRARAPVKKAVADALATFRHPRCIPLLARWVGRVGEDDELRRKACRTLGLIGDDAAMPALSRVLGDRTISEDVRCEAALAIGSIRAPEARALLAKGLTDVRPCVRAACVAANGLLGLSRADLLAVAEKASHDDAHVVRLEACRVLERLGPQAGPVLQTLLADATDSVATAAREALGSGIESSKKACASATPAGSLPKAAADG
jgi:HEAT repeat protein